MEADNDTVYGPQWSHPHPSWSNNEKMVAFASDRTGFAQVTSPKFHLHLNRANEMRTCTPRIVRRAALAYESVRFETMSASYLRSSTQMNRKSLLCSAITPWLSSCGICPPVLVLQATKNRFGNNGDTERKREVRLQTT